MAKPQRFDGSSPATLNAAFDPLSYRLGDRVSIAASSPARIKRGSLRKRMSVRGLLRLYYRVCFMMRKAASIRQI